MIDDTTPKRPYARHVHRFWIPVAWKYQTELTRYGWMYVGMEAIVLRCDCGKEVRREGGSD